LQRLAFVAHAARSERAFDQRVPPAAIAELDNLGNDFNALLDELESWQTHLQNENETLAHQASHDSLTGLPNRAFFEGRLIRALRNANKLNEQVAVLFLDSDRFKEINDGFGHAAGDAVLVAVASRVRAQLREDDLVARLGGDEFAVLLTPLHKIEDAEWIADKIIASMEVPIPLPGNTQVLTSLSIGIAVYPDHGTTPGALINAADAAMYQAKRLSRGAQQHGRVGAPCRRCSNQELIFVFSLTRRSLRFFYVHLIDGPAGIDRLPDSAAKRPDSGANRCAQAARFRIDR